MSFILPCSPLFCSFVAYLSDIVADGLAKAIIASLNQLHSQVRASKSISGATTAQLLWFPEAQLFILRTPGTSVFLLLAFIHHSPACMALVLPSHLHSCLMQISMESIARNDLAPLLEVQLELAGPTVVWSPEVTDAAATSVRGMLLSWVKSYFEIGTLMKRLDSGEGEQLASGRKSTC